MIRKMFFGEPFFGSVFNDVVGIFTKEENEVVKEEKEKFIVKVGFPGYSKEDMKVEVKEDQLIIKCQKDVCDKKECTCKRVFYLPEEVNQEGITAKMENGLLTIEIPKKEEEIKPELSIEIK
jgi:HSP20 family protein